MKVKDMKTIISTNKYDNTECNFKLKTGKPKITLLDVMKEIKLLHSRLDNIVAKNSLKE